MSGSFLLSCERGQGPKPAIFLQIVHEGVEFVGRSPAIHRRCNGQGKWRRSVLHLELYLSGGLHWMYALKRSLRQPAYAPPAHEATSLVSQP